MAIHKKSLIPKSSRLIIALLLVVLAIVFAPGRSFAARSLNFTELGTHPEAASQPTSQGKTINSLKVFDGMLLASYGDFSANTGPITVNPFDIASGSFDGSAISIPTESLGTWRIINNKAYATTTDPTCSSTCPAGYVVYTPGSGWEFKSPVNAEHMFDIATLDGTDLWLFGSAGGATSTAWRSTDDGQTWNVAQTHENEPGGDNSERYYWGASMDGKMYMQSDFGGPINPFQVFDGNSWSTGTTDPFCSTGNAGRGPGPVLFKNRLICENNQVETIRTFDGQSTSQKHYENSGYRSIDCSGGCSSSQREVTTSGSNLYVLESFSEDSSNYSSNLMFTNNLDDWQEYDGLPGLATSVAVDDQAGKIYVGTSDSKIYVANLPGPDTTLPSVNITSPSSGSTLNTSAVQITVDANDEGSGVSKVEFYLGDEKIATDKTSPYSADWQNLFVDGSWQKPAGMYSFKAVAYDSEGNSNDSEEVSVRIVPPNFNISEYSTGSFNTQVTKDDQGNLWFANGSLESGLTVSLSKFNTTNGHIETFPIPDGQTFGGFAVDRILFTRGRIWTADCSSGAVKAFVISTAQIESFSFDRVCQDGIGYIATQEDGTIFNTVSDGSALNIIHGDGSSMTISPPAGYTGFLNLANSQKGQAIIMLSGEAEGNPIVGLARLGQSNELIVYHSYNPGENDNTIVSSTMSDDGDLWFSHSASDDGVPPAVLITRIKPDGERIDYQNTTGSSALRLVASPDGTLWFVLYNGQIGRIGPGDSQPSFYAGLITPFPPGFAGMSDAERETLNRTQLGYYSGNITVDDHGNLWVSDGLGQRLLKVAFSEHGEGAQNTEPDSSKVDEANDDPSSRVSGLAATGQNVAIFITLVFILATTSIGYFFRRFKKT